MTTVKLTNVQIKFVSNLVKEATTAGVSFSFYNGQDDSVLEALMEKYDLTWSEELEKEVSSLITRVWMNTCKRMWRERALS